MLTIRKRVVSSHFRIARYTWKCLQHNIYVSQSPLASTQCIYMKARYVCKHGMNLVKDNKSLLCLGATHPIDNLLRSAKRCLLATSRPWETEHISESPLRLET